jgi:hypothetical protein
VNYILGMVKYAYLGFLLVFLLYLARTLLDDMKT